MDTIAVNISKDFSPTPGPRYIDEGSHSGEEFRIEILYPKVKQAIENNMGITIVLDGTDGYGTSFLEEAFGGLIRTNKLNYDDIKKRVSLISNEEDYLIDDINEYLSDAYEETTK